MTQADYEKVRDINLKLKEILLRHMDRPCICPTAIKGLVLVRREAANSTEQCFAQPLASLIVQGSKHSIIGTQQNIIRENQCLVTGVDMPSSSCTINSTSEKPFLSLFFYLDRQILTELLIEMEPKSRPPLRKRRGIAIADAEPEFLEGVLRLVELLDKPQQIAIRAPIIMRELHYLLLIGAQGSILQGLYSQGSQNTQAIEAITLLKQHIASPVRVEELARQVNMSVSSLYRHFKNITGFSPLQYHKQLRLYEAQRLMLMENERAANAALSVGYESVTQFNREYKRMFGAPPHRDVSKRRGCAV
ncbi:MAG: AraC family transcriptional regulator [Desulfovibrionaceae bacterium]|nr:AraC family transcriptional regulator [Desulfovibrionaceae bacterium]